MTTRHRDWTSRRQSGVVLIISMIILAVLSILGVSTMRLSISELELAGHTEEINRAFQAADAGLTAAVSLLKADASVLMFNGDSYSFSFNGDSSPLAGLGSDTPAVTVEIHGDRDGKCPRTEAAASADILGCIAFELISTHAPAEPSSVKSGALTVLREGISQQVIKRN